ncbi:MAG TPA: ParA family protein [Roseiarcus sp.]|nr:ParA family protein [Roseiarcus sp.]
MKTIALVTQKGGAGKSTLASSLAVAAGEAGERVCLIDMDPQATLSVWGKTRGEADIPVIAASPAKLPAVLAALAEKGVTLAFIDTPGAEGAAASAAMAAAQLCVIPSRPTAFDLWASANTRKALKDIKGDYVFLLNQCPPAQQNARVEEGMAALEAMGGLLSPLVLARVDYQEAARRGWGVTELNPNGAAAGEMRALWASLKKRLAKAARPVKKAA